MTAAADLKSHMSAYVWDEAEELGFFAATASKPLARVTPSGYMMRCHISASWPGVNLIDGTLKGYSLCDITGRGTTPESAAKQWDNAARGALVRLAESIKAHDVPVATVHGQDVSVFAIKNVFYSISEAIKDGIRAMRDQREGLNSRNSVYSEPMHEQAPGFFMQQSAVVVDRAVRVKLALRAVHAYHIFRNAGLVEFITHMEHALADAVDVGGVRQSSCPVDRTEALKYAHMNGQFLLNIAEALGVPVFVTKSFGHRKTSNVRGAVEDLDAKKIKDYLTALVKNDVNLTTNMCEFGFPALLEE